MTTGPGKDAKANKIKRVQGYITKESVDAIANAASEQLAGGGRVDGVIHRAGGPHIVKECDEVRSPQGGCPSGQAVVATRGYLPVTYVIHTAEPIWHGGNADEPDLLESCYGASLPIALGRGIKTIAFSSISTGMCGCPINRAATVTYNAVKEFVEAHDEVEEVCFVLFDDVTYRCFEDALSGLET